MWNIYDSNTFGWRHESRLKVKRSHASSWISSCEGGWRGGVWLGCLRAPWVCDVPRMVWIRRREEMESSCPPCLPTPPHTRPDTSSSVFSTHLRDTRSSASPPPIPLPGAVGAYAAAGAEMNQKWLTCCLCIIKQAFIDGCSRDFHFFTAHNLTVNRCKQVMASTLITGGAEMIILHIIAHNVWKMICFGYGPLTFYLKGWFLS